MSTPVIVGVDCSASARACAGKLQHLPNRPAAAPMRSAAGVGAGRVRPDPDQPPLPRGNAARSRATTASTITGQRKLHCGQQDPPANVVGHQDRRRFATSTGTATACDRHVVQRTISTTSDRRMIS